MMRHTKEQCFRIVGFLDWWSDNHKTKNPNQEGKVATAIGNNKAASNGSDEKGGGSDASKGMARAQGEGTSETGYQDGCNHWTWH